MARYKRFSDAERREMLLKTDYIGSVQTPMIATNNTGALPKLLELLKRQAPIGKEQAWNMILDGLLALLGSRTE
ncbi:MAG: hypothetical protein ACT4OI_03960 [Methanobacteriota archaeon]